MTVVLVAVAARLVCGVVSWALHDGVVVPDEATFLDVAHRVADGRGAASLRGGYGQDLYEERWLFLAPLARLAVVFGRSRLPGVLLAVAAGAATAGLIAAAGRRLVPSAAPASALTAGLVVALTPSQVLWSSVVLTDASVWAALGAVAFGIIRWHTSGTGERPRIISPAAVAGGLLALGWLRPQTLVLAAWALAITAVLTAWRQWPVVGAAAGLAAAVPLVAGLGVAGTDLVREQAPQLGQTRTLMSIGAESGLVKVARDLTLPPDLQARADELVDDLTAPGVQPREVGTVVFDGQRHNVFVDEEGQLYLAQEGTEANLRHLPTGLSVALLRPYPGSVHTSLANRLASFENVGWYVLYALAIAGLWRARAVAWRLLTFPVVFTTLYVAGAALSQGNAGLAFRHRGQILWALTLCVVAGFSAVRAARP